MNIDIDLSKLNTPELIVMVIFGALLLLFGYRIKKVAFFIIWFLIGFNLMRLLMPWVNSVAGPGVAGSDLWQFLLPVAGGLLLAMLGFTIEKICVAGIVFGTTLMVTSQYFGTDIQVLVIGAIIGIILAGVAVMLMKPAIIIVSALMGAYVITIAVLHWANIDAVTYYFPLLLGISVIGATAQFLTTKRLD